MLCSGPNHSWIGLVPEHFVASPHASFLQCIHVKQCKIHTAIIHHTHTSQRHSIKRNLKGSPRELKRLVYISLVWSGMEYASIMWDPHLCKDKDSLEIIQRRAALWITSTYCIAGSRQPVWQPRCSNSNWNHWRSIGVSTNWLSCTKSSTSM